MFKVTIKKNGIETNAAAFGSQEELDQWFAKHEGMGTFGPFERYEEQEIITQPMVLDEDGNILQDEIREVRNVLVPSDWSKTTEDLTAQVEAEKARQARKEMLRVKLKSIDFDKITTIKALKEVVSDLQEALN